jgi:hypothetical protein
MSGLVNYTGIINKTIFISLQKLGIKECPFISNEHACDTLHNGI